MLTLVRSHAQGDTKEYRSRPAPRKAPCKKKVQTFEATLDKAKEILQEAAPSRMRGAANNKQIFRTWTSCELESLLKKAHLVHRARERSDLTVVDVRRLCVRELLRQGFLTRTPWGEYKPAPEVLAQAS